MFLKALKFLVPLGLKKRNKTLHWIYIYSKLGFHHIVYNVYYFKCIKGEFVGTYFELMLFMQIHNLTLFRANEILKD